MPDLVALVHAEIITGTGGQSPFSGYVEIDDGKIASVGHGDYTAGRPGRVIDLDGLTVVAGMIDAHAHLFVSGEPGDGVADNPALDIHTAERSAKLQLQAGVTTVRDLGGPTPEVLDLTDRIAAREITGPRVMPAGRIITCPGGHAHNIGIEVRGVAQVRSAVEAAADSGVACIKISISGGVSTPEDLFALQFGDDEVLTAVETAHSRGLHVAAHASIPEAIRMAARLGVDSVEHAVLIDDAALEALRAGRTTVVPTLSATDLPPGFLNDPSIPDFVREKAAITIPGHRPSIRRIIAAGITVAGGTDAGSSLTPHGCIAREARQLTLCGLSNEQALLAVTRNAAELLRLGDQLGTIEVGKRADLVVLGGNPLADIGALADVRFVYQDGRLVSEPAVAA